MIRHEVTFEVTAPHYKVWRMFHPKTPEGATVPRTFEHPNGTITILKDGDDDGAGLVRTATFPVPKWLLSGGVAESFEVVVEARKNEFARYEAVGKPLWSRTSGWHTLEAVDDTTTRLTFVEIYEVKNPLLRRLFEKRVHDFISRDNDDTYRTVLGHLGTVTRLP
ncbi:MAG TPA: hypothetical protein VHD87_09260 [Acidimicrobiales bacterium]|nr:hypothetical protein [Acidimicrobiales bacterium]